MRAEALAALARASTFDELWSWLRQRAAATREHSAAAAANLAATPPNISASGNAYLKALGWDADLALALLGRLQALGRGGLPAPSRRTLLREATFQWLAAALPAEQQPAGGPGANVAAAAAAPAGELGARPAAAQGGAAAAGAGVESEVEAAERRHLARLATGGEVLQVAPSAEAAEWLLAALRGLGDSEQPSPALVLAVAAPHFARVHRAIYNGSAATEARKGEAGREEGISSSGGARADASLGGSAADGSADAGATGSGTGGVGDMGLGTVGLPPAKWPPASATAAALVSLGAELVRSGFAPPFTGQASASAGDTRAGAEAPVFEAVWDTVKRCVALPPPDPSLPPLPALMAAAACLRVELMLAQAAEVQQQSSDVATGMAFGGASGAVSDGTAQSTQNAQDVLAVLRAATGDTALLSRAMSAGQMLACAQRVEAAEAAAEAAAEMGQRAVVARAGSRSIVEAKAATLRGDTRAFVGEVVRRRARDLLDTQAPRPEQLLALAHTCLLLEKRGARAVDDPLLMRQQGQALQDALGTQLLRRLHQGQALVDPPPPPPSQSAPAHRHGRARPPPPVKHHEEQEWLQHQQQGGQQEETRRAEQALHQQLVELLFHPRNICPPLTLRQAATELLGKGEARAGFVAGAAAAAGSLWDHVSPALFDVLLRRLMATPIYWRWESQQPLQAAPPQLDSYAGAEAAQGTSAAAGPAGQASALELPGLDFGLAGGAADQATAGAFAVGQAEVAALQLARMELSAAEEEAGAVAAAQAAGVRPRASDAALGGLGHSPHAAAANGRAARLPRGLHSVVLHMTKVVEEAEEDVRWASRRLIPAALQQAGDPAGEAAASAWDGEGAVSRVPAATAFGLLHLAADLLTRTAPPAGIAGEVRAAVATEEGEANNPDRALGQDGTQAAGTAATAAAATALLSHSSRLLARLMRPAPHSEAAAAPFQGLRGGPSGLALAYALAEQYGRVGQVATVDDSVLGLIAHGAKRGAAEALQDAHALGAAAAALAQAGAVDGGGGGNLALERARAAALEARLRERLQQLATVSEVLAERWYEPAAGCGLTQQLEQLLAAVSQPHAPAPPSSCGSAERTGASPAATSTTVKSLPAPAAAATTGASTTATMSAVAAPSAPPPHRIDHDAFRLLCAAAWLASLPRAAERLRREESGEQAAAAAVAERQQGAHDGAVAAGGGVSSGGLAMPSAPGAAETVGVLALEEADARALRLVRQVEDQVAAAVASPAATAGARAAGLLSLRTAYALTEAFMNVGVMPPVVQRLLAEEVPLAARSPLSPGRGGAGSTLVRQARAALPVVVGGRSRVMARVYEQVFAARVLGVGAAGAAGGPGGAVGGSDEAHDVPHSRRVRLAVRLLHEGIIGPRDALAALRGDLEHVLPRLADTRRLAALVGMVVAAPTQRLGGPQAPGEARQLESGGEGSAAAVPQMAPELGMAAVTEATAVEVQEGAAEAAAAGEEATAREDRAGVLFRPLAQMARDRAVPLEHLRILCAAVHSCQVALPPDVHGALTERLRWEIPLPKPLRLPLPQRQHKQLFAHAEAAEDATAGAIQSQPASVQADAGSAPVGAATTEISAPADAVASGAFERGGAGHPSFSALAQTASDADHHAHLDQLVVFWLRQLRQLRQPAAPVQRTEAKQPKGRHAVEADGTPADSRGTQLPVGPSGQGADAAAAELHEGGLLVRVAARAVDSLLVWNSRDADGSAGSRQAAGGGSQDNSTRQRDGSVDPAVESLHSASGFGVPDGMGAQGYGTGGAEAAAEALRLVCLVAPTLGSLGAVQQGEIANRVLAVLPARPAGPHAATGPFGTVSPGGSNTNSQLGPGAPQTLQLRAPFLSAADAVEVLRQLSCAEASAAAWSPVQDRVLQLLAGDGDNSSGRVRELVQLHLAQAGAQHGPSAADTLLQLLSERMDLQPAAASGDGTTVAVGALPATSALPAASAAWRREAPALLASLLQETVALMPPPQEQEQELVAATRPPGEPHQPHMRRQLQAQVQLMLGAFEQASRLVSSWLSQQPVNPDTETVTAHASRAAATAPPPPPPPPQGKQLQPQAAAVQRLAAAVAASRQVLDPRAGDMPLSSLHRYLAHRGALGPWLELQQPAPGDVVGMRPGGPCASASDPLGGLRRTSALLQLSKLLPDLRGVACVFKTLAAPYPTEAPKSDEEPGSANSSQAAPADATPHIERVQAGAFSDAWQRLAENLRLMAASLEIFYDPSRKLVLHGGGLAAAVPRTAEMQPPAELMQVLVEALKAADDACAAFTRAQQRLHRRSTWYLKEYRKQPQAANVPPDKLHAMDAAAQQVASEIIRSDVAVLEARDPVWDWQRSALLPLAEELVAALQAHAGQMPGPVPDVQAEAAGPEAAKAVRDAGGIADMLVTVLRLSEPGPMPTSARKADAADNALAPLRRFRLALRAATSLAAQGWWHDSLALEALLASGPAFHAAANTGGSTGPQGGGMAAALHEVALPALRLHAAGCGGRVGAGTGAAASQLWGAALVQLLQAMEAAGPAVLRAAKAHPSAGAAAAAFTSASPDPASSAGAQPPHTPSGLLPPPPPPPLALELLLALSGVGYVRGGLPHSLALDVLWQLEAARDDAECRQASGVGRMPGGSATGFGNGGDSGSGSASSSSSSSSSGRALGLHHTHLEALLAAAPALAYVDSSTPGSGGRRAADLLEELCRVVCNSGELEAAASPAGSCGGAGGSGGVVSVDALCALAHALSQASTLPQTLPASGLGSGFSSGATLAASPSQHASKLYSRLYMLLLRGAVGPGSGVSGVDACFSPSAQQAAHQHTGQHARAYCGLPTAAVRLARLAACGRNRGDVLMAVEAAAQLGGLLRQVAAEGDARTCAAVLQALDGLVHEGHDWICLVRSPPPPQPPRVTKANSSVAGMAPAASHWAVRQVQPCPVRTGTARDITALLADWSLGAPAAVSASGTAAIQAAPPAQTWQAAGVTRRNAKDRERAHLRSDGAAAAAAAAAAVTVPAAVPSAAVTALGPAVVAELLWRAVDVLPAMTAASVLMWALGGSGGASGQALRARAHGAEAPFHPVHHSGDGDEQGAALPEDAKGQATRYTTTTRQYLVRVWRRVAGRLLPEHEARAVSAGCFGASEVGAGEPLVLDAASAIALLAAGEALGCADVAIAQALADVVGRDLEAA
ncbi:hypothetical protein HYH02_009814 [Chlamydomonas schloesseri]|uniref:Uncharacterized protein n=1 Tax=Chlamydomonas schloesseri TaxID=2026947 RepID=A0A835TE36_9CHLO|nr:hypothetical protein HYH02_009814 [Chlamydomonas schloesseri]|eukprot:KAG2442022.1 hypothetical protein HYH02_009814 [Chlamydomonas schloesseri]